MAAPAQGLPHATRCCCGDGGGALCSFPLARPAAAVLIAGGGREDGTGMAGGIGAARRTDEDEDEDEDEDDEDDEKDDDDEDAAGHGGSLPALVALRVPGVDQRLDIHRGSSPRAAPRLRAKVCRLRPEPTDDMSSKSIASAARSCAPILATLAIAATAFSREFAAVATAVMLLVARRSTSACHSTSSLIVVVVVVVVGEAALQQWDERAEAEERQRSHEQWNDAKAEEVAVVEEVAAGRRRVKAPIIRSRPRPRGTRSRDGTARRTA